MTYMRFEAEPGCQARCKGGGERGIRTLEPGFPDYSLSRRAPSSGSAISPKLDEFGGGSRIRTHGGVNLNGFQDRRFRPLSHPSRLGNVLIPLS